MVASCVLTLGPITLQKHNYGMKLLKPLIIPCVAAGLLSLSAQANSYSLTHLAGLSGYQYLGTGAYYENTFNLPLAAGEVVDWAQLSFAFADDAFFGDLKWLGDAKEYVTVDYDGTVQNLGDVDGSYLLAPLFYDWRSISGGAGSVLVNALQDGILHYKVTVTEGDTYLKEVNLKARTSVGVPDGGSTLAMLGLGILGLSLVRRFTAAKATC